MAEDEPEKVESTEMKGVDVFFPDEYKKGVYSNNVFLSMTPEEFVMDFLNVVPPIGSVVSRVVISPSHAKRLAKVLKETVDKYEETYGEVPEKVQPLRK